MKNAQGLFSPTALFSYMQCMKVLNFLGNLLKFMVAFTGEDPVTYSCVMP